MGPSKGHSMDKFTACHSHLQSILSKSKLNQVLGHARTSRYHAGRSCFLARRECRNIPSPGWAHQTTPPHSIVIIIRISFNTSPTQGPANVYNDVTWLCFRSLAARIYVTFLRWILFYFHVFMSGNFHILLFSHPYASEQSAVSSLHLTID